MGHETELKLPGFSQEESYSHLIQGNCKSLRAEKVIWWNITEHLLLCSSLLTTVRLDWHFLWPAMVIATLLYENPKLLLAPSLNASVSLFFKWKNSRSNANSHLNNFCRVLASFVMEITAQHWFLSSLPLSFGFFFSPHFGSTISF